MLNITDEDFKDWRDLPVTKAFFAYLEDNKKQLLDLVSEAIIEGTDPDKMPIIRWQENYKLIDDVIGLEFQHIADFYGSKGGANAAA